MAAAINYPIKFNVHYLLTIELYIYSALVSSIRKSAVAKNISD